jgi:hypothetical protein
MLEQFTLVTEFSRHFYTMLNRDGAAAPTPNSQAAEKVDKIVSRLKEYGENLSRKKNVLLGRERENPGEYIRRRTTCSVMVINEMSKLIARVEMKWETYKKRAL